jgi:hypothetical protein
MPTLKRIVCFVSKHIWEVQERADSYGESSRNMRCRRCGTEREGVERPPSFGEFIGPVGTGTITIRPDEEQPHRQ